MAASEGMYYVYQLIDPRTDKPFYVGKGSSDRMYIHEKEAFRGSNHPKCKVIREIHDAGLSVKYEVVERFNSENDAYCHEAKVIKQIGRENLTNLTDGGVGAPSWIKGEESDKEIASDRAWVRVVSIMAKKTNGFTLKPVMRFCGIYHEISDFRKEAFLKKLDDVLVRRGEKWVNSIAKKIGVEYTVSKVEALDGCR